MRALLLAGLAWAAVGGVARADSLDEDLAAVVEVVRRWGWVDLAESRLEMLGQSPELTADQRNLVQLTRLRVLVAQATGRDATVDRAAVAGRVRETFRTLAVPEPAGALLTYLQLKLDLAKMEVQLAETGGGGAYRQALTLLGELYDQSVPLAMRTEELTPEQQGDVNRLINDVLFEKGGAALGLLRAEGAGAQDVVDRAVEDWENFLWPIEDLWARGERDADVALEYAHGMYGLAQVHELAGHADECRQAYAGAVDKIKDLREARAVFLHAQIAEGWVRVLLAQGRDPEEAVRTVRAAAERGGLGRVEDARVQILLGNLYQRCHDDPGQQRNQAAWREKLSALAQGLQRAGTADRTVQALAADARRRWASALGEAPAATPGLGDFIPEGQRLAAAQNWAGARACFRAAGARPPTGDPVDDPAAGEAWRWVAATYYKEGRFLEAAHAFRAALHFSGGDAARAGEFSYMVINSLERAEAELASSFRDGQGRSIALDWDVLLEALVTFVDGHMAPYLSRLDPQKEEDAGRIRNVRNIPYRVGVAYARPRRADYARSARYLQQVESSHPQYVDALRMQALALFKRTYEDADGMSDEERAAVHREAVAMYRRLLEVLLAPGAAGDAERVRQMEGDARCNLARLLIVGHPSADGFTGEDPRAGLEILAPWEERLGADHERFVSVLPLRCAAHAAPGLRDMAAAERDLEQLQRLSQGQPPLQEVLKKTGQRLTQDYRLYLQEVGEGGAAELRTQLTNRILVLVNEYGGEGMEIQFRALVELWRNGNYADFYRTSDIFRNTYGQGEQACQENFTQLMQVLRMLREAYQAEGKLVEAAQCFRERDALFSQVRGVGALPWEYTLETAAAARAAAATFPAGDPRAREHLEEATALYLRMSSSYFRLSDAEQRAKAWAPAAQWVELAWELGAGDAAAEKVLAQGLFSYYHRSPSGRPFGGPPHTEAVLRVARALAESAVEPATRELVQGVIAQCEPAAPGGGGGEEGAGGTSE